MYSIQATWSSVVWWKVHPEEPSSASSFCLKNDNSDFQIRSMGIIYVGNEYDSLCELPINRSPPDLFGPIWVFKSSVLEKTFDRVSSLEHATDGGRNKGFYIPENMARSSRTSFTGSLLTSEETQRIWNGTGRDPPKLDKFTISWATLISNVGTSVDIMRWPHPWILEFAKRPMFSIPAFSTLRMQNHRGSTKTPHRMEDG